MHRAAFGRDAESVLVDRLRDDNLIVASVVAVTEGQVVANVVFSRLRLRTSAGLLNAAALAPVAVLPAHQRRGLGAAVIRHGLRICAERDCAAVFVLGDPDYYARFGFSHELAKRVSSPYSHAGSAWMALEFQPSSISNVSAEADYPQAFNMVGPAKYR